MPYTTVSMQNLYRRPVYLTYKVRCLSRLRFTVTFFHSIWLISQIILFKEEILGQSIMEIHNDNIHYICISSEYDCNHSRTRINVQILWRGKRNMFLFLNRLTGKLYLLCIATINTVHRNKNDFYFPFFLKNRHQLEI